MSNLRLIVRGAVRQFGSADRRARVSEVLLRHKVEKRPVPGNDGGPDCFETPLR